MKYLLYVLSVFAAAGVYVALADSPPYNPDQELCNGVADECAELDGMCCEGLNGGCCVNGKCLYNTTACKEGGERCGRVRCSSSENCVRSRPCVCCPNCVVAILPTCRPKCGVRSCFWNEECVKTETDSSCVKKTASP